MKNKLNLKGIPLLRKKKKTQILEYNNEVSICLNCNTKLVGSFCHSCGQKHIIIKRPLIQIIGPVLDSLFSLDNKLFRTLPALIAKPGFLSREFIEGKRIRYTAPFKLFMFSSIICFFLLGISEGDSKGNITIDAEISMDGKQKTDSLANSLVPEQITQVEQTENRFNQSIQQVTSNPAKYKARIFKALSYMFFVLMPLFALLLKLLTRKKKHIYIEHIIHSVHIHTFGFCIFSMAILIDLALGNKLTVLYHVVFGILLTYTVVSIKKFYSASWLYSIWKSMLLVSIYSVVFIFVMVSSLLIALLL